MDLKAILPALVLIVSAACATAQPAVSHSVAVLGLNGESITLTATDLATAPRRVVRFAGHDAERSFEGVLLTDILARVGAPSGSAQGGQAMTTLVLVTASDGYQVAFTLAELDPAMGATVVLLADSVEGAALGPEDGPFRLVVEGDRRGARSARMVTTISLLRVGS